MGCDYAFESGRSKAIIHFHKILNELLEESTSGDPSKLTPPDYWRKVGRQDILLQLLSVISEMTLSKY